MPKPTTAPTSLKQAIAHLNQRPRVEIFTGKANIMPRLVAVYRRPIKGGLEFTVYNGPAQAIGKALIIRLDGGDSEWETSIEFTPGGFIVRQETGKVEILYSTRQPWRKDVS